MTVAHFLINETVSMCYRCRPLTFRKGRSGVNQGQQERKRVSPERES